MHVHLINPSHHSFGTSVITPRWLYVLGGATPRAYGDPLIHDETLETTDFSTIRSGDVVGIGIHTGNALRGYEVGLAARARGARVIFGGIHATLYPDEPHELGGAHSVVKGDGDAIWPTVLAACASGNLQRTYDAGRVAGDAFVPARWELLQNDKYMWASVQTIRGCPKHCSFCSVWRTDGQLPRVYPSELIVDEIVQLRRNGFRFIALADDNFYPVSLADLSKAQQNKHHARLAELQAIRHSRLELMESLAQLPSDTVFFTQITMEAADDPEFLAAMSKANIKGALVGVESVSEEGLKSVYKDFNPSGADLIRKLHAFRDHHIHVLGSFIFGLPTDDPKTFDATARLAQEARLTFAQFVTLTPFPGTVDFEKWEREMATDPTRIDGQPLTRYWLIQQWKRPKLFTPHPRMSQEQIRRLTLDVWHRFYSFKNIWARSRCVKSLRARFAFMLVSKLYLQMYGKTGIATDSARVSRANTIARWLAKPLCKLFKAAPLPDLRAPHVRSQAVAPAAK